MDNNKIIGGNIKLFREKLGISQEELGGYLGVTHAAISKYESGGLNIPSSVIDKTSKLFGIDEYDLYEDNVEQQQASVAFAFRAEFLTAEDLNQIATFHKIVRNYLKMQKVLADE
jgi:transcriptional regulator with XRE-family HTH domain